MEAGLFTIGGVIIGSILTYTLTRRWQREQWIADSRKEEFRELLTAIAKSMDVHIRIWREGRPQTPEDQVELQEAVSETFRTFHDRVFISEEIDQFRIEKIWVDAAKTYKETFDAEVLFDAHDEIRKAIVKTMKSRPKA